MADVITPGEAELAAAKAAIDEADGIVPKDDDDKTPEDGDKVPETDGDKKPEDEDDKKPKDEVDLKIKKEEKPDDDAKKKGDDDGEPEPLDMEEFYTEFAENGSLSDESRETIESRLTSAGFLNADAILTQYMNGATSEVATVRAGAFEITGGEDNYVAMAQWADENLSEAEVAAFDEAVETPSMVSLAVRGLFAQYTEAGGPKVVADPPPVRVPAGVNVQRGLAPITSTFQISELTADPRFDADPGFRAEVEARIAASIKAGVFKQ